MRKHWQEFDGRVRCAPARLLDRGRAMDTKPSQRFTGIVRAAFLGEAASCGRIVVSWTATGGVTAGGMLIGLTALASAEEAQVLLPLAPVLFLLGAVAGLLHGAVLAYVGRPLTVSGRAAVGRIFLSFLGVLPALVVGWVVAAWISLTGAVLAIRGASTIALTSIGWVAGLALCFWAASEGWHGVERAFTRWPESRPGAILISGSLAILALTFVLHRPPIGHTNLRLTGLGAVILAIVATIWIATPLVIVSLHYLHKWFAPVWDRTVQL